MAVGQGAIISALSYLAVGEETTFKSYNTCTAGLPFISASFKTMQENKILEEVRANRVYQNRTDMMKMVNAEIEAYFYPDSTACAYLLKNAFGVSVTSATATGETTGGGAFTHTFNIGNFDTSVTSLCFNKRKGDSASGFVYEYSGFRINEFNLTAEIEDALKFSVNAMGVDSTSTSNDVASALGLMAFEALNFAEGRISFEDSLASLTTTSYWHVQSINFGINNSIKSDAASGRIGSPVLDVLPAGVATFPFTITMRFDTLTAYNAMLNATRFSAEFEFLGTTISGSALQRGLKLTMPKVYISDSGDPAVSGADEFLTSEITCHVLYDASSSNGYAVRGELTNEMSSI